MNEHKIFIRLVVAILFSIAFVTIGFAAPMLYSAHAPQSQFIEVHEFTAQDASTNTDEHYLCFNRTVHQPTSGTAYTELYLVNGDSKRVEVGTRTMDRYFQEGSHKVITPMQLSSELGDGQYRYLLVLQMELSEGRVTRTFVFESDTFTINSSNTEPAYKSIDC